MRAHVPWRRRGPQNRVWRVRYFAARASSFKMELILPMPARAVPTIMCMRRTCSNVHMRTAGHFPVVRAGTYLTRAVPDGAAFGIFGGVCMACKYIELCPSASGWCNRNVENHEECIPFLISAAQHAKEHRVAFECDRRACDHCSPWCHRTFNIRHAKNFEVCNAGGDTIFQEVIIDE